MKKLIKIRKKHRKPLKNYQLYADHTLPSGIVKQRAISEVEARSAEEASKTGFNLAKMLGMTFTHAKEVTI
jgi:hypothetical protein